jgi:hypothetical protein
MHSKQQTKTSMNTKTDSEKSKSGWVGSRLTKDEQTRVEERAEVCGLTVSEWARQTLLEALERTPMELRLMHFVAAQTIAIRFAMSEWQQGHDLEDTEVQGRIQRLASKAAADYSATQRKAL